MPGTAGASGLSPRTQLQTRPESTEATQSLSLSASSQVRGTLLSSASILACGPSAPGRLAGRPWDRKADSLPALCCGMTYYSQVLPPPKSCD